MARLDIVVDAVDRTRRGLTSAGRNIDRTEGRLRRLGGAAKVSALALGGIGIAAAGIGVKLAKDFLQAGDELDKFNRRTGISIEQIQKLSFAADQSGTDIETVEKAFLRATRVVGDASDGLKDAEDTLNLLGLSAAQLSNTHPDELFYTLADAVASVENPLKRAQVAQELFGRSGAQLIPLLEGGAEGLRALTDEAERNGNIMSTEAAQAAAAFNDSLNSLKQRALAPLQRAFVALTPSMITVVDTLTELPETTRRVETRIRDLVTATVASGSQFDQLRVAVGDKFRAVWDQILPVLRLAFEAFTRIHPAARLVRLAVTAVTAVVERLGISWADVWSSIRTAAEVTVKAIETVSERIEDAVAVGITFAIDAAQKAYQTAVPVISNLIQSLGDRSSSEGSVISDAWQTVTDATMTLRDVFTDIWQDQILPLFDKVREGITAAVDGIVVAWDVVLGPAARLVSEIVLLAFEAIRTFVELVLLPVLQRLIEYMAGPWSAVWRAVTEAASTAWDLLVAVVQAGAAIMRPVIEGLGRAFDLLADIIRSLRVTLSEFRKGNLSAIEAIQALTTTIVSAIPGGKAALRVWTALADSLRSIASAARHAAAAIRSIPSRLPGAGIIGSLPGVGSFFGATGGIVTRPTLAVIGEAGPEAVVPLSRAPGASPLPAGSGGGQTINILLDGQTLAQFVVESINQASRSGEINAIASVV